MVDNQGNVTGILDWDAPVRSVQSNCFPQPFGIACGALPFIGCTVENNRWKKSENYPAMEEAFWKAMMQGASDDVKRSLRKHWWLVRVSVQLGIIFTITFRGRLKKWIEGLDNGVEEIVREITDVNIDRFYYLTETGPGETAGTSSGTDNDSRQGHLGASLGRLSLN